MNINKIIILAEYVGYFNIKVLLNNDFSRKTILKNIKN